MVRAWGERGIDVALLLDWWRVTEGVVGAWGERGLDVAALLLDW